MISAAAVLAAMLTTGCSSSPGARDGGSTSESANGGPFTVAIALEADLPAIDANVAGFKAEMAKRGFVDGQNVRYVTKNAEGQMSALSLVAKEVVESRPDLILSLGTDLDVAIAKLDKTTTILFSLATDPVGAGLVRSTGHPGGNVTGTSDYIDPAAYFKYLRLALPDAKRIGLIGNVAEQNTASQIKSFRSEADSLGLSTVVAPTPSTNDIVPAIKTLSGRVDALLVGGDATLTSADKVVIRTATQEGIPVVFNGSQEATNGALIGLGPDYERMGTVSGDQAADILLGHSKPASTAVAYPAPLDLVQVSVNEVTATQLGITLPPALTSVATVVGG